MEAGPVASEAWALYRRHWRHLLPISFVVYVLVSLLTLALGALLGLGGAVVGIFVNFAGIFWLQGVLVEAVADIRDGRADLTLGETLVRVRPRVSALGAAGVLAALGIIAGFVLLIVPGLVLLTWWSVVVPVIVLERAGVLAAFGRSRELVRGNGWSAFGVVLWTLLAAIAVSILASLVLRPLPDGGVQEYVTNVVSSSLSAPFAALAWTLMYWRLRALRG